MSPLSLDFATAQRSLTVPRPYLGFGLLLAGALFLVLVAWKYDQQLESNRTLRLHRDQLTARAQHQQPREQVPAELSAQFDQAADAYAQITTPWDELLHALEVSRDSEIDLLSLTADATKKGLTLGGEAKNFGALSRFSDTLSANPMFPLVALLDHTLREGAPPIVVKFNLMLSWRQDSESRR